MNSASVIEATPAASAVPSAVADRASVSAAQATPLQPVHFPAADTLVQTLRDAGLLAREAAEQAVTVAREAKAPMPSPMRSVWPLPNTPTSTAHRRLSRAASRKSPLQNLLGIRPSTTVLIPGTIRLATCIR